MESAVLNKDQQWSMRRLKQLKPVARALKIGLLWSVGTAVRYGVPAGPNRGCLVLKIDALGDLFLWFSAGIANVASECKKHPGPSVLLVRPELADFVRSLQLFDIVWPVDPNRFRKNPVYRVRLLYRLRRFGFTKVLQLRIARELMLEDMIVQAVGAADARSVTGDSHNISPLEERVSARWFEIITTVDEASHEYLRNARVTEALVGASPIRFEYRPPELPGDLGLRIPFFVIAPGAGWVPRKWPIERFCEISARIKNLQCVIVGTRADREDALRLAEATGGLDLSGKLDVAGLASVVSRAAFVLGNESGVSHMAAYFGVPGVSVLGGGHFGWFMPYPQDFPGVTAPQCAFNEMSCFGCNWQCRYQVADGQPMPCIVGVETEVVWQQLQPILNAYRAEAASLGQAQMRRTGCSEERNER